MFLLLLTREPCLLEVLNDPHVVLTVVGVVGRSVTKLAQEGCELVEELPELRMMYSYWVFAALEGTKSLSFCQTRGLVSLLVDVHEG